MTHFAAMSMYFAALFAFEDTDLGIVVGIGGAVLVGLAYGVIDAMREVPK